MHPDRNNGTRERLALLMDPQGGRSMSSSKQPKSDAEVGLDLRDNLKDDPGIGRSKGRFAMTDEPPIVKSDATPEGGVDPNQQGRTNK
jgi:hypothetical protein